MRVSVVVADVGREAARIRAMFAELAREEQPHTILVSAPAPIGLDDAFAQTEAARADLLLVSAHGGYDWGRDDGWRLGPRPSSSDRFPARRIDELLDEGAFPGTMLLFACRYRSPRLRPEPDGSVAETSVRSVLAPGGSAHLVPHERGAYNAQARRISEHLVEGLRRAPADASPDELVTRAIAPVPVTRWWPPFHRLTSRLTPETAD